MDDGLHYSLGRFGGKDAGRGLRSLMCMGMIMETTGRRERDVTATSSASGGRVQSGTVTGSANDYGARGRTTPDPRSVSYLVSFLPLLPSPFSAAPTDHLQEAHQTLSVIPSRHRVTDDDGQDQSQLPRRQEYQRGREGGSMHRNRGLFPANSGRPSIRGCNVLGEQPIYRLP